jgi:hypothetical protein
MIFIKGGERRITSALTARFDWPRWLEKNQSKALISRPYQGRTMICDSLIIQLLPACVTASRTVIASRAKL